MHRLGRRELCDWQRQSKVKFIEPHANFIMIDVGRNAREFINTMPRMGVAPGRPLPPLDNLLRVTIGSDQEIAKFREVSWKVYIGVVHSLRKAIIGSTRVARRAGSHTAARATNPKSVAAAISANGSVALTSYSRVFM